MTHVFEVSEYAKSNGVVRFLLRRFVTELANFRVFAARIKIKSVVLDPPTCGLQPLVSHVAWLPRKNYAFRDWPYSWAHPVFRAYNIYRSRESRPLYIGLQSNMYMQ